jgi:tetratricopeptide (TPR) repeat protein
MRDTNQYFHVFLFKFVVKIDQTKQLNFIPMKHLERVKELLNYLEEEPNNPFNLYALALEYQNKDKEKASFYFNKLLAEHKDYLPTYYHAALLFADQEQLDLADKIFTEGIELAKNQNNSHAKKELENAYLNFQFEND